MKVILADSSSMSAARLMNLLEGVKECEIVAYSQSVSDVLRDIATFSPRIIVLDLDLRGGTGLTILRHVKRHNPEIKVIILTNASNDQYRKRCMEIGADHFLDKSCEVERVPSIIRTLIRNGNVTQKEGTEQL